MNQEKKESINVVYQWIIFVFSLLALICSMTSVMVHFQWAVSIYQNVMLYLSCTFLAFVSAFDRTCKIKNRNKIVFFSSLGIELMTLIALIGSIMLLNKEGCGIYAIVIEVLLLLLVPFYCYLHFNVEDKEDTKEKKKKILSRVFAFSSAAFVLVCCIITPIATTGGTRLGYPLKGCVKEEHCPFSYALPLAKEKGMIEEIKYDINLYTTEGKKTDTIIHKRAKIYLPYGYNKEENKDKKYDILYLSHGATYDENHFFNTSLSKYKSFFDKMIEEKKIRPMIVVTPCLYTKDKAIDNAKDSNLTTRFQFELRNILIPLIEAKYRTYASDTTPIELEKSRTHRSFAGYSMGSITTLSVFEYNLDYFSKFIPMSAGFSSADRLVDALEDRFNNKFTKDDFKIAMAAGGRDFAYNGVVKQYEDMHSYNEYFKEDVTLKNGNYSLYIGTNHRHGSEFVIEYFYVYLPMLFAVE